MFNATFLNKITQKLNDEKNIILEKTKSINSEVDASGDEIDAIQGNYLLSMQEALSQRELAKINKIDIALSKIKNKQYGLCEECEEEISEKRLEINPYFTMCVDCAEKLEYAIKHNKERS